MSVRTARTWQRGRLPSEKKGKRRWRTRPDSFAGVWAEEVEPLLRGDVEGALKATTILEWLDERHPGRFSLSQLRTLQRRLRDWRALSGPDREVFLRTGANRLFKLGLCTLACMLFKPLTLCCAATHHFMEAYKSGGVAWATQSRTFLQQTRSQRCCE